MPSLPNRLLIDAVQRASMRAAADERIRLKRGLGSLATIAATAPLFGFLGTVIGIINSFPGCGGEKSICLAAVERLLSEALMPIVLGLAAAIPALCFYKYLTGELETLDLEMQNTAVDLANHLVTHGSFTFLDELISPDCVIVK
jgi:biopolymer transport protein ExbB/TolQ